MTNEPFTLIRPQAGGVPILHDSPHSGRIYPDDFNSALPVELLRRAEDAYVDQLLEDVPDSGATLLHAHFPRVYIDANRSSLDIHPRVLADRPGVPLAPGEKSVLRIGLIREIVTPGLEIYDRKLAWSEVERRIERCWRPYRTALTNELHRLRDRHGRVLHIQWHSMKSVGNAATPDGPGNRRPDMVLGDRHGRSCSPAVRDLVDELLRQRGYRVALNDPYAGGAVLGELADVEGGIECLQVEINRALYLDEIRVEKTAGFAELKAHISSLTNALAEEIKRNRPS